MTCVPLIYASSSTDFPPPFVMWEYHSELFLKTVNNLHDLESKLYFQLNYKPMGKILMSGHISDQSAGGYDYLGFEIL